MKRLTTLSLAAAFMFGPAAHHPASGEPSKVSLPRLQPWRGDFDGMQQRRVLRLIVPYSKTLYFIDRGKQMGVAAEFGRELETWLNKRHARSQLRLQVMFVPTAREKLLAALNEGLGDAIAANLTITPERQSEVDFATPWLRAVREIVVTGPAAPSLNSVEELSGQIVRLRPSSSYAAHVRALSSRLVAAGRAPIDLRPLSENLEDEDILEMVGAGLLPFAVVDEHKAEAWKAVFKGLTLRPDLVINEGGDIAWAIRKGSPRLKAELDAFFSEHRAGSSFGNTIRRRYFGSGRGVRNAASPAELEKFRQLVEHFITHGRAVRFDPVMLAAQGYQESMLDQSRRSRRGAVGVMQLLPSTAAAPPISITGVERDASLNIEAGAKYMRHLMDRYVNDPPLAERERTLMVLAAYNAGPGNLRKFRRAAAAAGLDSNVWFNGVEQGAARIVGRETVQYVGNIYKYFIAFELALERIREQADASASQARE